ncbi:MAG: ATP-binding protein [Anaerolineae bacterium]|nr:ATP-binding protein [Anaerolineae bacterium]
MSSRWNRQYRPFTRRRSGGLNFGFGKPRKKDTGEDMRYERLVQWAKQEWTARYDDAPFITIWASSECSNKIAQKQIKSGRKLRGKARYVGLEELDTDVVVPISDYGSRGRKMVLTATAGAFVFTFADEKDENDTFDVIYASSYIDDDVQELTAVALVPEGRLETWASFEAICARAVRPRIRRRRDVYIIGGTDAFFDPTVDWDDVILDPNLKSTIMDDIEAFFNEGVDIYRKLKLTPFRKLLMAGVPGTGKTMLCAALARHALNERRIVVYVSGSDRDGATFEKMQRAFQAVASAHLPTLLIVEEIDAYLRGDDKARILNVLDGIESPNNSKGTLMISTTNYPEAIDDRIFKRPGRLDRIFVVPTIEKENLAEEMLRHYMADQWMDNHAKITPKLIKQPGAFVREVALHARMIAAHEHQTEVTLAMLQKSVDSLLRQMRLDGDFLLQRRPLGLGANGSRRRSGFDFEDDF